MAGIFPCWLLGVVEKATVGLRWCRGKGRTVICSAASTEARQEPALHLWLRLVFAPEREEIVAVLNVGEVWPGVYGGQAVGVVIIHGGIAPPDKDSIASPSPRVLMSRAWGGIVLEAPRIAVVVRVDCLCANLLVLDSSIHHPAGVFARIIMRTGAMVGLKGCMPQLTLKLAWPLRHPTEVFAPFVQSTKRN